MWETHIISVCSFSFNVLLFAAGECVNLFFSSKPIFFPCFSAMVFSYVVLHKSSAGGARVAEPVSGIALRHVFALGLQPARRRPDQYRGGSWDSGSLGVYPTTSAISSGHKSWLPSSWLLLGNMLHGCFLWFSG